jgi:hypothetical protein
MDSIINNAKFLTHEFLCMHVSSHWPTLYLRNTFVRSDSTKLPAKQKAGCLQDMGKTIFTLIQATIRITNFVLPGNDAASVANQIPTFRGKAMGSSSTIRMCSRTGFSATQKHKAQNCLPTARCEVQGERKEHFLGQGVSEFEEQETALWACPTQKGERAHSAQTVLPHCSTPRGHTSNRTIH